MKKMVKGDTLSYTVLNGKLYCRSPLTGWNRVDNTDYCGYVCMFPTIYPTHREAKARGKEAHHITPKASQKAIYGEVLDDSCLRVTAFEHFLLHWQLSRECDEGAEMLRYLGLGKLLAMTNEERKIIYEVCGYRWKEYYDEYLMSCNMTGRKYMETLSNDEFCAIVRMLALMSDEEMNRWLDSPYENSSKKFEATTIEGCL